MENLWNILWKNLNNISGFKRTEPTPAAYGLLSIMLNDNIFQILYFYNIHWETHVNTEWVFSLFEFGIESKSWGVEWSEGYWADCTVVYMWKCMSHHSAASVDSY